MSAVPTPACMSNGALLRITVSGTGGFSSPRMSLDDAREALLAFHAEVLAGTADGRDELVPFRAGGRSVELLVRASRVTAMEVVRVSSEARS